MFNRQKKKSAVNRIKVNLMFIFLKKLIKHLENNFHQNGDENTNKKRKQDPFIQSLDDEEEGTNNNL